MSLFHTLGATGDWNPDRHSNLLDGAAHFYDVYKTSDAKYVSIGSIEPQFYELLIEKAGLEDAQFAAQYDELAWPELKRKLQSVVATRTRDEWCSILEGTDVCFAPVLDYEEAPGHHHNQARQTYIDIDGLVQPAPAPRFSRTAPDKPAAPHAEGSDTREILLRYGFEESELVALQNCGAIDAEAQRDNE
jgi:alpha-methylacyl-CoA racemase